MHNPRPRGVRCIYLCFVVMIVHACHACMYYTCVGSCFFGMEHHVQTTNNCASCYCGFCAPQATPTVPPTPRTAVCCWRAALNVSKTIVIGVIARLLDRLSKLKCSLVQRPLTPSDASLENHRQDLPDADPSAHDALLVVKHLSFESRSGVCAMTQMVAI